MVWTSFRTWVWRQNHTPYVWHRFWSQSGPNDFVEVKRIARKLRQKPGKERLSYADRPWSQSTETLSTASKDLYDAPEINHLVGGVGESMGNVPIAFKEHIQQMVKDRVTARHFGLTIDLKEFHTMLGQDHVQGMFGRGRIKALMTLIYILSAIIALLVVGIAYTSSNPHIVCYTPAKINGTETVIACPVVTHTTSEATSSPPTTTSTIPTNTVTVGGG